MSDQGFHEIHLNGKQLVFLFMAATVVSVVIFLCGVLVGRGVRPATASIPTAAPTAATANVDATAGSSVGGADSAADPGPHSPAQAPEQAPPPIQDDDDYDFDSRLTQQESVDRLQTPNPPAAQPDRERPAPATTRAARQSPAEAVPVERSVPAAGHGTPQPGTYAVQLVALRERTDADAIAKRLAGKGYSAYVVMPSPGGTPVYKVQVGRFKTRGEAEKTAARLSGEEQFKPWVTR